MSTDQSRTRRPGAVGPAAEQQGDRRQTVRFDDNRERTPAEHLPETGSRQAPRGGREGPHPGYPQAVTDAYFTQFSILRFDTLLNSDSLLVINTQSIDSACAAISISREPIGVPCLSKWARILP